VTFDELYTLACDTLNPRQLSDSADAGGVAAALETDSGHIYKGVCIDTACSLGFCAEHAAIAAMITAGENRIVKIVAVGSNGKVMPPCGRCREFIAQVHPENMATQVMVARDVVVPLSELLPFYWRDGQIGKNLL